MKHSLIRLSAVLVAMMVVGFACRERVEQPSRIRSLTVHPGHIEGEPRIRLQLKSRFASLNLSVTGPFGLRVTHLDGRTQHGGGDRAVTVVVKATPGGVQLGQDEYKEAEVIPRGETRVLLDGKPFPGNIRLRGTSEVLSGKRQRVVRVIVRLGIEEYLVGVVPNELPASWPIEALRAQAVASRSYALYSMRTRTKKPYDVVDSVDSQVWRPSTRSLPRVNMAVNSTRGIVVTENFQLFPTFFHSQAGGRTASANPVFVSQDITALTSVRCPFSEESSEVLSWNYAISKTDLSRRLQQKGLIQGAVKSISPLDIKKRRIKDRMDRVYWVEIVLKSGVGQIVNADRFRAAVGSGKNELASTLFNLVDRGNELLFEGRGFGHGVGMSQYGAKYLAENKGWTYDSILLHYYTGTRLVRLWGE